MKLGKKPPAHGRSEEGEDNLHLYCPSCGKITNQVFEQNEFVLVSVSGDKPYYGRINRIESAPEGPMAIVEKGSGDRERVHLEYVEKL